MSQIPDYGNLKMNMEGFTRFLKDSGVELNETQRANINSIFKECDTENAKGEKGPDGELTGKERMTFLDRVKAQCSELYQQATEFFTVVDVVEGLKGKEESGQESDTIGKEESDKGIESHSAFDSGKMIGALVASSASALNAVLMTAMANKSMLVLSADGRAVPLSSLESVKEEGDKEQ